MLRAALDRRASTGRGAGLCGYGGVIELLQAGFSTTRSAEWLDALANAAGASLAVLFRGLRCMKQK
jgi:VanZ family protein